MLADAPQGCQGSTNWPEISSGPLGPDTKRMSCSPTTGTPSSSTKGGQIAKLTIIEPIGGSGRKTTVTAQRRRHRLAQRCHEGDQGSCEKLKRMERNESGKQVRKNSDLIRSLDRRSSRVSAGKGRGRKRKKSKKLSKEERQQRKLQRQEGEKEKT